MQAYTLSRCHTENTSCCVNTCCRYVHLMFHAIQSRKLHRLQVCAVSEHHRRPRKQGQANRLVDCFQSIHIQVGGVPLTMSTSSLWLWAQIKYSPRSCGQLNSSKQKHSYCSSLPTEHMEVRREDSIIWNAPFSLLFLLNWWVRVEISFMVASENQDVLDS